MKIFEQSTRIHTTTRKRRDWLLYKDVLTHLRSSQRGIKMHDFFYEYGTLKRCHVGGKHDIILTSCHTAINVTKLRNLHLSLPVMHTERWKTSVKTCHLRCYN